MIRNSNAMRVAAQIAQDLSGAAEGRLGVNHPVLPMQPPQQLAELLRISQEAGGPGAAQLLLPIKALQTSEELAAEHATKNLHRQEERIAGSYPVAMVRRQPARWNGAVNMGMKKQVLSPGMQNADYTDFRAQVFWIGLYLQQCLCAGVE